MACKASYELHHHFPKLAEESGFTFNTHRQRIRIDWNKIRLIDVEILIRERKFNLIEQHVNDILDCVLESEFDVRILDEGVLKMFRLAQLAVEYQQFCRHYLDRSVYVLREEVTSLARELDATKRELRDKDDELRKFKRKTKSPYKPQLPYGNENIATMILKTLANKSDMFPSTPNTDALHYNKCNYCDKVFLNQLYLKSHISRRHSHASEVPEKEFAENIPDSRNTQLNDEINQLKTKLKEMENLFLKRSETNVDAEDRADGAPTKNSDKEMKDAEVSAVSDGYILDKIEEWKKEEHEKYNKEINLLRTQIIETMNDLKSKGEQKIEIAQNSDHSFVQKLHATIKQQGEELLGLKQELNNSKIILQSEEASKNKEKEIKLAFWEKKAEEQSKQYESLLEKLNVVANEAHESKTLAEAERQRAVQLEELLQKAIINNNIKTSNNNPEQLHLTHIAGDNDTINKSNIKISPESVQSKCKNKSNRITDRKTLEKLHQKAQELLDVGIISSSDVSSASTENVQQIGLSTYRKKSDDSFVPNSNTIKVTKKKKKHKSKSTENKSKLLHSSPANTVIAHEVNRAYVPTSNELKLNKEKSRSHSLVKLNGTIQPGSPNKLVRAKLTEEVNNHLVSIGVDPLKSRLHKNLFKSKRMQLQKLQELKAKKNPGYERVKHSILAYLDSSTAENSKEKINASSSDSISPNKLAKNFSITSVISNVKNKALALVKSHDMKSKTERNLLQSEVTKRALTLLKTPSHSATSSPENKPETISTKKEMPNTNEVRIRTKRITNSEEKPTKVIKMEKVEDTSSSGSDNDSSGFEGNGDFTERNINQKTVKSIENLIKSPARRPSSSGLFDTNGHSKIRDDDKLTTRAQSASNILKLTHEVTNLNNRIETNYDNNSAESETSEAMKRSVSEENVLQIVSKQTKGVLKSASSLSSLNKKKVLFDMDAIQMKSVSASPSQSTTEKSDNVENYELGLVNLENEEWDISSIENEPLKNDTKIQINTRTSPKIAELKQTIESQLARRNETPSTAVVGGVDVLSGGMARGTSLGGSNTSLGSSILDESEHIPVNHRTVVKPKKFTEEDESDLDLSEFSIDGLISKSKHDGF